MQDIGFVGVGTMAAPMVWRFIERGWRVHLLDPAPEATAPFHGHTQATVHDDVAALLHNAGVVLLSLPSPAILVEVAKRLSAATANVAEPAVVINTSTTGLIATREAAAELTAAGLSFVDAPVSGGAAGARRGSLTIMVSGAPKVVARCTSVFEVIGEHVLHVGPEPAQAQVMKVANNLLSLGALAATAEATALTSKAGIPLDVAIDVLNVSSGRNSATAVKFPDAVLTGLFNFGFPTEGALKDVSLFAELASELGAPAPLASAVAACWRLAVDHGYGEQDCTRIATMYEQMAGLPVQGTSGEAMADKTPEMPA
ncbi:NAD(P)-dependent oxidoreductase [Amycolatopsis alkalitolerans]|uniref:NAD(P)-dependent oxidoreductase n=1 Tax=Amycolatopsis alkalitolerans TaxID=2547244 RepID=A0A5C4MD41_9PSEU|nr:NAD(P)-dependent oxidoreductase [Amycolatopsis alkalitolerans]TNC29453.1 NAD(P)-dependent oxidoreductase [Amycolatopsis alkalitolerans]